MTTTYASETITRPDVLCSPINTIQVTLKNGTHVDISFSDVFLLDRCPETMSLTTMRCEIKRLMRDEDPYYNGDFLNCFHLLLASVYMGTAINVENPTKEHVSNKKICDMVQRCIKESEDILTELWGDIGGNAYYKTVYEKWKNFA